MSKKTSELTEAEWEIIKTVWEHQPCAAPAVQEELEKSKGWSYSTVKTMMGRMVAKKLLKTEKIRNLTLYRASITKKEAQSSEIMKAVKRAFDGALTPMMQFLLENENIAEGELVELERAIKYRKNKK